MEGTACAKSPRQKEVASTGDMVGLETRRAQISWSLSVKGRIFNVTLRYQNATEVFEAGRRGRWPGSDTFFIRSFGLLCGGWRLYV